MSRDKYLHSRCPSSSDKSSVTMCVSLHASSKKWRGVVVVTRNGYSDFFSSSFLQSLIKFNKRRRVSNCNARLNTPLLRILIGPLATLLSACTNENQGRGEASAITIYILPGESRDSWGCLGGDVPWIMDPSHRVPASQCMPRHRAP
jgi:hypothetical protein